ncbi:MAG: hypothetical protein MRY72_06470 [Aquisalinus sp.]|nr:hypothetical protein [Aquisalinus sp.]
MAQKNGKKRSHRDDAQHESFLRHKNFMYLKWALFICLISIVAYFLIDPTPRHNGGTWYGYTLGTIGALLIVWLTMLGVRKRAITAGKWSLKGWTSAHVYLGLSLTVIATLHTGFQFGWNIHTLAYALMMLVIISGAFGIYFYANIPRAMSENRAETTQAEMIQLLNSLDDQLEDAARPLSAQYVADVQKAINDTKITGGLFTRLSGRVNKCATARALAKLREAAEGSGSTMVDQYGEDLSSAISILDRKSVMLNRVRRHIRYKSLLELWLYIHVPATIFLLAALTAHILSVFFYW